MPVPTRPAPGAIIDPTWGQWDHDGLAAPHGVLAVRTIAASLPHGVKTFLAFAESDELRDVGGWHSNVNNTRFTVPADQAGIYQVFAQGYMQDHSSVAGLRELSINLNGNAAAGGLPAGVPILATVASSMNGVGIYMNVGGILKLAVGDYLEIAALQFSGVALNFNYYRFGAVKLGEA